MPRLFDRSFRLPLALFLVGACITTTAKRACAQAASAALPQTVEILPQPRDWRIGDRLENLTFTDLDGDTGSLADYADRAALVIALRDVLCPVAAKLGPTLAELEAAYAERNVAFLFVNPSSTDSADDRRAEVERLGLTGRYAYDRDGALLRALRAETTTEVFVLDRARTLRYRGAVNDQFSIGGVKPAPTQRLLESALDAVLAGREPSITATRAPGCLLNIKREAPTMDLASDLDITWHNQISRLIQSNCQSCHRADGVGPFPLETYEQAKARRNMIRAVVDDGIMPPWHAAPGHGPWLNDRSLPERDKAMLRAWVERGAPEGDPADAPIVRQWSNDWQIGEPDVVVAIPKPVSVPASGVMDYIYQWVQVPTSEDKWLRAIEIRPSAPQVVHHVLVFIEEPPREGESRQDIRRRWQGGLQGYFAGLVPGQGATIFPEGFAKKLPAGAWLKFQLHYTANGRAVEDRTEIAFVFADEPPKHEIQIGAVATTRFEIPPGAEHHEVVATTRFRSPATILGFSPHMHLRGKAFRYDLEYPDGRVETLIEIPHYDFDWQTMYRLITPLEVPAGAVLRATAHYDNSSNNPTNPDPTKRVGFGEQTWDEMMIGYFEYWREEAE